MNLQTRLLDWFSKHQRPLPWRRHYRPYEVWISEVMLQQTQVGTMLPYYRRWMRTFPTIRALAKADGKKVLKLWEGLGYYSRARNLHAGAKRIVEKYGGRFPGDYETILSLKGIGRYSAGAIASIAFNQNRPIVDGNVLRVLARVYAIRKPIDATKNHALFWDLQERLIPENRARDFNQALMELGALVCSAQNPSCPLCPIRSFCKAVRQGNPEVYPVREKRKKTVRVVAAAVVIGRDGKYFIRRRPVGSVMGGLWEFPEWKLAENRNLQLHAIATITRRRFVKEFGIKTASLTKLGAIKRNYTHHLETLHVFRAAAGTGLTHPLDEPTAWSSAWVTKKDFRNYPFSSAHAKIAALLNRITFGQKRPKLRRRRPG